MQRIPFPIESYEHASKPLSDKQLLNFFPEAQPADARSPWALISTPGLTGYFAAGEGPVSAVNSDLPGLIYLISGGGAYRYTIATDALEFLGEVDVPFGAADYLLFNSIAVGPTAVVFCVPPYLYVSDHVNPVNRAGIPDGGASSVTYLDGYFVCTNLLNPEQFFVSQLLDPTNFDALDFASLDAFPNEVFRVMTVGTDLWFAGAAGWEIWYDTGAVSFPFQRQSGGILQRGPAIPKAIAFGDGSVWWVSIDGIVYRSVGYQALRVSTTAIEEIIRSSSTISIQSMLTYSQGGHNFVALNLPARTLVYDTLTGKWHERASTDDGTGRWRIECACAHTGLPILGDSLSGSMFFADPTSDNEFGTIVQRQITFPPIWAGTHRAFMNRLEIEMAVGGFNTPGQMALQWSDDGGFNFNIGRVMNTQGNRAYTTRCGSFHQRVLRLTMFGLATLYAADADITAPLMGG